MPFRVAQTTTRCPPLPAQVLVVIRRPTWPTIRIQRKPRHISNSHPTMPLIQPRRITTCHRIQHQQRPSHQRRMSLRFAHQRLAQPASPRSRMHLRLHQIRPMRLIVRQVQHKLHRPTNPALILRNQQHPLTPRNCLPHACPKPNRSLPRNRQHKPNRCAPFHAINQHVSKLPNLRRRKSLKPPNRVRQRQIRAVCVHIAPA